MVKSGAEHVKYHRNGKLIEDMGEMTGYIQAEEEPDETLKGGAPLADHGAASSPSLDPETTPGPHQEQGGMRS